MSQLISIIVPIIPSSIAVEERINELLSWSAENLLILEILLVVDGDQDERWKLVKEKCQQDSRLEGIYLQNSGGIEACTLCGLISAKGNYILTIDAESKYRVRDISTLFHVLLHSNCNMVYGFSAITSSAVFGNLRYRLSANLFSLFTGLPAYISQFRIMEASVANNLTSQNSEKFIVDRELHRSEPIYAGVPIKIKTKWFVHKKRGLILQSNLTFGNMITASNVVEYFGVLMLISNIYLLWQGYIWQSTLIAILAGYILLKTFRLKWRNKESFEIKESYKFTKFASSD